MPESKVFISYSHKDEHYREELEKHLVMLRRNGLVQTWTDRKILPGQEWSKEINTELEASNIILLLISSDFLASDYCFDIEVKQAMKQHEKGTSIVVPIILRPCDWHDAPFGILQGLPKDAKPIKEYPDIDSAFLEVVKGLKKILTEKPQVKKRTQIIAFELVNADITTFPCDVLVLKYAQYFYGADKLISRLLVDKKGIDISELKPDVGQYRIIEPKGHMECKYVMFLGVPELWTFRYSEISDFSRNALVRIKKVLSTVRSIAFTIHGVGYGLDEVEAFQ
jgi:TIR domain